MDLFRSADGMARYAAARPGAKAATLGKFDGLHLGHGAILQRLVQEAGKLGGDALVLTFDPHPAEVLQGTAERRRVYPLRRRLEGFRALGADACGVLRFDGRLRSTSAKDFIAQVLEPLNVATLVLGRNFRFGAGREGGTGLLRGWGRERGARVVLCDSVLVDGAPCSTTRVRAALDAHDLCQAARLLGRPWQHSGLVQRGRQLGKSLGFATANLGFGRYAPPLLGVYAARVALPGEAQARRPAVCNIGERPTVDGKKPLLEAHLLDFSEDLYGRRIRVVPEYRVRGEQPFDSLDALRAQIAKDRDRAAELLRGDSAFAGFGEGGAAS